MSKTKERLYSAAEIKHAFAKWHEDYLDNSENYVSVVNHVRTEPLDYAEGAFDKLVSYINN